MKFDQRQFDNTHRGQILFLISIALVAATLVAYEPIRHNEFISFDDDEYIVSNPSVSGGITRDSVIWAFTKSYAANWHPLTWISHMLDCGIYGLNPLGHHITNLLIHIAASLLLFLLLSKMTAAIWPSAFVAAVFALHPVHVESVAWAAERKDVLSGLFWMLTILSYIRYAERPNFKRYVPVLLTFVMGLMSKPMVVTLPLVLLLLDWWPLERFVRFRSDIAAATKKRQIASVSYPKMTFRHLVAEKVPLFVLSALSCVITTIAQRVAVAALERIPLNYRIANTFLSYISYIGKAIWPSRLAVFYPPPLANLSVATAVGCSLLFFLITAISIFVGRRRRYAAVGWLWYVGTLVPVIGLVQVGSQAMADRYMYIPMVGLLIIVAWAVKDLVDNRPSLRIVTVMLAAVVLSSVVILTRMQVGYWRNSLTLFEHALKVTENNDLAESGCALALADKGRFSEAELHLRRAIQISVNPTFFDDRINLGFVLLQQGKFNEAVVCLSEVIKNKSDSAKAYYFLAVALEGEKKYDEAIKSLTSTLKLEPNYPDARKVMGSLLLVTGKLNEAVPYFNEALRIDANQVEIYRSLGAVYEQLGKYEQAIQSWKRSLELEPDNAEVLNNLAWVLAATGGDKSIQNGVKAVEFAKRACELTGYKEPVLLGTLVVAYAAAGRLDDAITMGQRAVEIAKARGQDALASEIQKRMEFYRAGKPYRQK